MKDQFFFSVAASFLPLIVFISALSLDNNFEGGMLFPWIEQSESGVKWKIENRNSPWESENAAPFPFNGTNYLRVDRGSSLAFGVAVLRSQVFTVAPFSSDTTFSFSFWIRSKWLQFTNLELYLAKNGNEGLLLNLYEYSNVKNRDWNSKTVSITDDSSSNLTLVFYAYCGTDTEDAVAIDDLLFITPQQTTSTTPYTPTEPPSSTTEMNPSNPLTPSTMPTFDPSSSYGTSPSDETESTESMASTTTPRPTITTTTPSLTTRPVNFTLPTNRSTNSTVEITINTTPPSTDGITTDPPTDSPTDYTTTTTTDYTTTTTTTVDPTATTTTTEPPTTEPTITMSSIRTNM